MKSNDQPVLPVCELLAQRLRLLEPEAFDEFSRYFGPKLKRRFLRLEPEMPVTAAEDLACELVTDIALKIHQYQTGSFRAWVYRAATTAFFDHKRRERLLFQRLDEPVEPAEEDATRQEVYQAVRDAMMRLSNEQQQIVRCYFFENNTNKAEIDRQFGWPEGKSRVYFKRAMERLKQILSQDSRIKGNERIVKLLT